MQKLWRKGIGFLQSHEPIGCRDYTTLKFMQSFGIPSYFSACLTLLTNNPIIAPNPTKIYLVDVSKKYANLLPQRVKDSAIIVRHTLKWDEPQ